jgi:hypothetical protein
MRRREFISANATMAVTALAQPLRAQTVMLLSPSRLFIPNQQRRMEQ